MACHQQIQLWQFLAVRSGSMKHTAVFSGPSASPSLRHDARETTGFSLSECLPFAKYVTYNMLPTWKGRNEHCFNIICNCEWNTALFWQLVRMQSPFKKKKRMQSLSKSRTHILSKNGCQPSRLTGRSGAPHLHLRASDSELPGGCSPCLVRCKRRGLMDRWKQHTFPTPLFPSLKPALMRVFFFF